MLAERARVREIVFCVDSALSYLIYAYIVLHVGCLLYGFLLFLDVSILTS